MFFIVVAFFYFLSVDRFFADFIWIDKYFDLFLEYINLWLLTPLVWKVSDTKDILTRLEQFFKFEETFRSTSQTLE